MLLQPVNKADTNFLLIFFPSRCKWEGFDI